MIGRLPEEAGAAGLSRFTTAFPRRVAGMDIGEPADTKQEA